MQVGVINGIHDDALNLERRDKSLFLAHVLVSAVLGVFCGE